MKRERPHWLPKSYLVRSRHGSGILVQDIPVAKSKQREEAIRLGLFTYFTGKPCKHGHVCERWVTSFGCVKCVKVQRRESKVRCYSRNPEKFRALGRLDYLNNTERCKLNAFIRHSRVKTATPPWVTKEMLKPFFELRNALTKSTGISHDVDHIYPLVSKDRSFCGLHVPWNLQVITSSCNRSKRNDISLKNK